MDKIWADFDVNNNGSLDQKELKAFTKVFLAKIMHVADDLDDDAFEAIFKRFDTNGNGTI